MKITRKRFNAELNTSVRDEKLLEIQIKPGWKEGKIFENKNKDFIYFLFLGTKITFEGEGDEGDPNTIAGDIVFIIRDKPHPIFERSNSDLIYRVKLTIKQALLGTLIVIPFLDSTKPPYQLYTYQEIITPQTEKRFLNEGLPYPKDPTKRGDLIVKFDILFPKLFNKEQRTFIDSCLSNSIDFYQPHDSVLHKTIIDQTKQQQEQPSVSTPTLTSQPSSNTNNNYHRHQKSSHRHINNNGRQKSPAPNSNNINQNKSSSIRIPPPVPPRFNPTSGTGIHTTKETVF
jgi:hypothetical protein